MVARVAAGEERFTIASREPRGRLKQLTRPFERRGTLGPNPIHQHAPSEGATRGYPTEGPARRAPQPAVRNPPFRKSADAFVPVDELGAVVLRLGPKSVNGFPMPSCLAFRLPRAFAGVIDS